MSQDPIKKKQSSSRSKKKKAFTIRIEEDLLDNINYIGHNILNFSPAGLARNYLRLSFDFLTGTTGELMSYDKKPLAIIPKELLKDLLTKVSEQDQMKMGDDLGLLININAQILGRNKLIEKLEMLTSLGWLDGVWMEEAEGVSAKNKKRYWKIPKNSWPLTLIHALLYRIITNEKMNEQITVSFLKEHLPKSNDDLAKMQKDYRKKGRGYPFEQAVDVINRYRNVLGGVMSNFESDQYYYKFEKLRYDILVEEEEK